MRRLIAAMKMSLDGKIAGPDGHADWVDAWSEDYGLTPRIDACLLGAGMYPGYEMYWSAVRSAPHLPLPMTGLAPSAAEIEWSRFAARTPHYVLSSRMQTAAWPQTRFLRSLDDVAALARQPGRDIYVMGGARTVASLLDARLIDEIRIIADPLIAGPGQALFATTARRAPLRLDDVRRLGEGRMLLTYAVARTADAQAATLAA